MSDPLLPVVAPLGGPAASTPNHNAKLKQAAQRFEATFLGEMIRLARPKPVAGAPFGGGFAEQSWGMFMDEALGQAMAAHGQTGLAEQVEQALGAAHGAGARK